METHFTTRTQIAPKKRCQMNSHILGIDVSKDSLDVQLIIAGMRKMLHIAFGVAKKDCP